MPGVRAVSELLPFVVAGLVTGSLYGLAGTGLVLTFKTSGVFNFAHGAVGAASAFVFFDLWYDRGLPWPLALIVSVGVLAPLLGLLLSAVAGRLATASTASRVVATVGVLLVIQGLIQVRYGAVPRSIHTPLPTTTTRILGTEVGYDQMITAAVALVTLAALSYMFRATRLGLQMRAVVDNGELVGLTGTSPPAVRAASWVIGCVFAGITGVLFAPVVGLNSLLLTLVVVQAFGAAALGRLRNLTMTFAGGLLVGVVQAVLRAPIIRDAVPLIKSLTNLDMAVSFLCLFLVLLLSRRGVFADVPHVRSPRFVRVLPISTICVALATVTVFVALLPYLAPTRAPVFTQAAIFVVILASLHLLVEVSGQVSLCHAVFVAIGATSFAHFTTGAGLPWLVGSLLAACVAVPVGAVVALPSIRLSGLYLALATFGFGIVVEQMAYNRPIMFGTLGTRTGHRPSVLGLDGDAGYFYLCVLCAVLAVGLILVIRRARLGRLLAALADSPTSLVTNGSSINVTRLLVFCVAAAMAAFGGALYVGVVGSVSSTGVSPGALISFNSLLWIAVLALAGRSDILSPVIAAVALIVLPSYFTSEAFANFLPVAFGLAALAVTVFGEDFRAWLSMSAPAVEARLAHSPVADRVKRLVGSEGLA